MAISIPLAESARFFLAMSLPQVARFTASRPEKKKTLDVLEAYFLKLLEGAKPSAEVRLFSSRGPLVCEISGCTRV